MHNCNKIDIRMKEISTKAKRNETAFKIILIGESATGKSCLMNRYVKNQFNPLYQTTIGTQFQSKRISINETTEIKMQIWDTAGQQSFRSIIKAFFRNASAILLIYNITDISTLKSLQDWKGLAKESAPQHALFVLVGTHLDLEQQRKVTRQMANNWMVNYDVDMFFETSSKTDINVRTVFQEIGKRLFTRHMNKKRINQSQSQLESIKLKNQKEEIGVKQAGCC